MILASFKIVLPLQLLYLIFLANFKAQQKKKKTCKIKQSNKTGNYQKTNCSSSMLAPKVWASYVELSPIYKGQSRTPTSAKWYQLTFSLILNACSWRKYIMQLAWLLPSSLLQSERLYLWPEQLVCPSILMSLVDLTTSSIHLNVWQLGVRGSHHLPLLDFPIVSELMNLNLTCQNWLSLLLTQLYLYTCHLQL